MNVFHRQLEDWKNLIVPVIRLRHKSSEHPDSKGLTVEWLKNSEVLARGFKSANYISVRNSEDLVKVARQILKEMREKEDKERVEEKEDLRKVKVKIVAGDFVKSTAEVYEGMYGVVVREMGDAGLYQVDFGGLGMAFKDIRNIRCIPNCNVGNFGFGLDQKPEPKFKPKQLVRRKGFADEVHVVFDARWNGESWEYSIEDKPGSYESEEKIMFAFSAGDIVKAPKSGILYEVVNGETEHGKKVNIHTLNDDYDCKDWKIVVLAEDRLDSKRQKR